MTHRTRDGIVTSHVKAFKYRVRAMHWTYRRRRVKLSHAGPD